MLRPNFALRQRALWERRVGSAVNRADYAPPVALPCRVDARLSAHENHISILLPAGCPAAPGDRIEFEGRRYLLLSVRSARDFRGRESHIEGILK